MAATVSVRGGTSLALEVDAREHTFRVDEPMSDGGTNTGPTPYELLLSALGGCTAMTIRLYADRKGWPLQGVDVELRHDRVHRKDCDHCESDTAKVDRIVKRLTLRGPLSAEQRTRLADIGTRCPVHRTLASSVAIEQELVVVEPGDPSPAGDGQRPRAAESASAGVDGRASPPPTD